MLWFALHLTALPLEALLAALPADAKQRAGALRGRAAARLLAVPRAAALGVELGMSAASAASLLPGCRCCCAIAAREAAFVSGWRWRWRATRRRW